MCLISSSICALMLILLQALFPFGAEVSAAEDMGYLRVTSQPKYALVYLDGRYTDSLTPTPKLLSVGPGKHRIALVKTGYQLFQDKITIESGKSLEVGVTLAKLGSEDSPSLRGRYVEVYMTVKSKPPGAEIYLDDELLGNAPVLDRGIEPGESRNRKLRIAKPGYESHEETIGWTDIRDRVRISVSAELRPVSEVAEPTAAPQSRRGKRFTINTQAIVLFIVLIVMIAVLATRTIIAFRRHGR